jgi:hypothetical protein
MTNTQKSAPQIGATSDAGFVGVLGRETSRLFDEANLWLDAHRGCVHRTRTSSGEHVAVVLPSGVSVQFSADAPGEYEAGIVLAVDEIRG